MTLVLGIDAGGSKTLAVMCDSDGKIVRQWDGPGLDPLAQSDWQDRLRQIQSAVTAGYTPAATVYALPFHGEIAAISASQTALARELMGERPHMVVNDVEAAFVGAFAGAPGILMLAGTGSMAWAGDGARMIRVGGYGDAFGDEGSGYWVGREALSLTAQALDGRSAAKDFADAVLAVCKTDEAGLIKWAYDQTNMRAAFARLAETVGRLAEAGDTAARGLLDQAAAHLERHVRAARATLGQDTLPWSWAGGLFRSPHLRAELERRLGPAQSPLLPPVGGALLIAARLAGLPDQPKFVAELAAALKNPIQLRPET